MFRSKMPCLISGNSEVEFQTKSDLFVIGDVEIVSSDSYFNTSGLAVMPNPSCTVEKATRRTLHDGKMVPPWGPSFEGNPGLPGTKKNPRNRNSSFDLEITVTRLRRTAQNMDKAFPKAGP